MNDETAAQARQGLRHVEKQPTGLEHSVGLVKTIGLIVLVEQLTTGLMVNLVGQCKIKISLYKIGLFKGSNQMVGLQYDAEIMYIFVVAWKL